jgi:hypothetical protein
MLLHERFAQLTVRTFLEEDGVLAHGEVVLVDLEECKLNLGGGGVSAMLMPCWGLRLATSGLLGGKDIVLSFFFGLWMGLRREAIDDDESVVSDDISIRRYKTGLICAVESATSDVGQRKCLLGQSLRPLQPRMISFFVVSRASQSDTSICARPSRTAYGLSLDVLHHLMSMMFAYDTGSMGGTLTSVPYK